MEGWRKIALGAIIGVAGTIYARDEQARRNLPQTARHLPDNLKSRFRGAVAAGREASSKRREEILRDLDAHGGGPRIRRESAGVTPDPLAGEPLAEEPLAGEPLADESQTEEPHVPQPTPEDATEPIPTRER